VKTFKRESDSINKINKTMDISADEILEEPNNEGMEERSQSSSSEQKQAGSSAAGESIIGVGVVGLESRENVVSLSMGGGGGESNKDRRNRPGGGGVHYYSSSSLKESNGDADDDDIMLVDSVEGQPLASNMGRKKET